MFIVKLMTGKMCLDSANMGHTVFTCSSYDIEFDCLDKKDILEIKASPYESCYFPNTEEIGEDGSVLVKRISFDNGSKIIVTAYDVFVCNENGKTIDSY